MGVNRDQQSARVRSTAQGGRPVQEGATAQGRRSAQVGRSAPVVVVTGRAAGPIVVAATGVAAAAYVAFTDDSDGPWLPQCGFHAMTGLWCPGCGLTRAVRAALHGDVPAALSANVLAPLFLVAFGVAWWEWWRQSRGRAGVAWLRRSPRWAAVAAMVVLAAFATIRNVPAEPWSALAP